jgi:hypothetical protein
VKLFGRRGAATIAAPLPFGTWLFERVTEGVDVETLPFARLEQLCSNAASLIYGAFYADLDACRDWLTLDPETQQEAGLLARRTADGFKASLADRSNVVIAWPWDHLATRVAWQATQSEHVESGLIGERLLAVGGTYALMHREQLTAVFDLWGRVAAAATGAERAPDLAAMGLKMLEGWRAAVAPSG